MRRSDSRRLLFVMKTSALNRGMQTGPEHLAWQLASRGFEIHVLSGGSPPTRHRFALPPNVAYHFTGGDGAPGDHVRLYRELRSELVFDAVIGWIRNLAPLAACEPSGSARPAFIAREGDLSVPRRPRPLRRVRDLLGASVARDRTIAEAWHGRLAGIARIAHVCPISRAVQDHVVQAYGIGREQTTLIPIGIDVDFFQPAAAQDYEVLQRPPRLLYTGNIVKSKGVGDVVEALQHVSVPVELVLCGNERGYLADLIARMAEIAGGHQLTWAGSLDRTALLGQLQSADIFVFCSWSEGLGKSLLEAMACGLPVIVSDLRAFADVVTDRQNGLVVPLREPRRIAAAIDAYLRDPALRARCGRNARRTIESRFTAASEIAKWLAVLKRQIVEPPAT